MRPEDVIADGVDRSEFNGRSVRKGTVKAALENVRILESPTASLEQKNVAKALFEKLIPDLIALDLPKFVTWKNPEIQALFDNYEKK